VTKKKGLIAQIYADRKRAQLQHERALREAERREERAEAARQRREAAAERARAKKAEQAERERAAREDRRAKEKQQRLERAEREKVRMQERRAREAEKEKERRDAAREKERLRKETLAQRERERKAEQQERAARQRTERQRVKEAALAEAAMRDAEAEERTHQLDLDVDSIETTLRRRDGSFSARRQYVEDCFNIGGVDELVAAMADVLRASRAPKGAGETDVQYDDVAKELMVKFDLPRRDIVPLIQGYKHVRSTKELRAIGRKKTEVVALYEELVAQTTLRVISELFMASPSQIVSSILFNGHVSSIDEATGHPVQPSILSVVAERETFENLNLDGVKAASCLHRLNAIVSPHPYDLVPVRPVWTFDPSRYKFVREQDVVAGLDHRPDLLQLTPTEFEHLIRRLYAAMGLKSWVTQASKDEGVDAIAVNEDPVLFGKCVIQAKRYKRRVDAESVYALAGVMEQDKASTGILVTTSYFGTGSKKFAIDHGRMSLHDGRHLKKLLQDHLDLDVLISLEDRPRDWEPADIGL
jgi:restriction system protein